MGKQDSARAVRPATPRPGDEHAGSANQVLAAAGSKVRHAHHTGGHDAVGSFEATPRLAQSPASPEDRIGQVLAGTYRIEELIAVGGMGAVYRASHARLSQPFAVKFLDPNLVRDAEAYGRFRQEAEIAAAVNHNNVLQVFDFSLDDFGSPYMVMELLQGRTLDIILKEQGALSSRELLAIFDPLCGAIDACHAAGVVHRDLKPSNIMVCSQADGSVTVKLLDFGISKIKHDGNDGMTRDNIVMGTPNYMSPEQASGQNSELDARADIFAIGAILYEALSGRRAFDADGLPQLLHKIVYKEPASLAEEGVPARVVEVVEACLAKKPEDRLGRAALIVGELKSAYEADTQLRKKSVSKGLGAGEPDRRGAAHRGHRGRRRVLRRRRGEASACASRLGRERDRHQGEGQAHPAQQEDQGAAGRDVTREGIPRADHRHHQRAVGLEGRPAVSRRSIFAELLERHGGRAGDPGAANGQRRHRHEPGCGRALFGRGPGRRLAQRLGP